ncbi:MAG: ABC transporter permease [Verrucomicrobiota bacterium]
MTHRLGRTFALGIKNLFLHKVRSLLTMLGIVFGVGSVIAMLSVGEGAALQAEEAINRLGPANIIVQSKQPPEGTPNSTIGNQERRRFGVTQEDVERIHATLPLVEAVMTELTKTDEVTSPHRQLIAKIRALPAHAPEVKMFTLLEGRFFTALEEARQVPVCLLTPSLAQKLFPFGSALGKSVRIESDYFQILGVVQPGVSESTDGDGPDRQIGDDIIFLPTTAAAARVADFRWSQKDFDEVVVKVREKEDVPQVAAQLKTLMEKFHRRNDYALVVPLELLAQARQTQNLFKAILGSIAAISLLVGGIGIMNIMLATVTERTREIGIRRALGAKRRDIIQQFLVETVVISLAGGLVGVALGMSLPLLITSLTDIPTVITAASVLLSVGISALVGILFGLYPARRAALLDPIEALRM